MGKTVSTGRLPVPSALPTGVVVAQAAGADTNTSEGAADGGSVTRFSNFEAEPPASSREGSEIPLTIRTGLRPVRRERGLPIDRKHEASRPGRKPTLQDTTHETVAD
jgi:hypothetical protein